MLTSCSLGDVLLEKETIGLPDIIKVLGERPYGMSETMKDYLQELQQREADEAAKKEEEEEQDKDSDDEGTDNEDKNDDQKEKVDCKTQ